MLRSESARLVVVDDEPEIRGMVADYLGKNGYAVSRCANGTELDVVLASGPADLVVLDVSMPGEDGLSIARRPARGTGDADHHAHGLRRCGRPHRRP
jgi:DNA-binding response OmpR family regulator